MDEFVGYYSDEHKLDSIKSRIDSKLDREIGMLDNKISKLDYENRISNQKNEKKINSLTKFLYEVSFWDWIKIFVFNKRHILSKYDIYNM